ncbi:MAG: hypothetical protein HC892_11005 [Saprospiraceae bacterium]|nr:hypothetical protein [Saprospiraceae bacterium]
MTNTITLSSDMNTLYLIDDERVIPFDLTNSKGVLIGVLKGQITVATADGITKVTEATKATEDRIEIPVKGNQWTVTYNQPNELMHVIGAVDIDAFTITRKEPTCKSILFDLKSKIVNLKRIGDTLEVITTPLKGKV